MADEAVELDERARVEQEVDPLARKQLPALVLAGDGLLRAARAAAASLSSRSQASFSSVVSCRGDIAVSLTSAQPLGARSQGPAPPSRSTAIRITHAGGRIGHRRERHAGPTTVRELLEELGSAALRTRAAAVHDEVLEQPRRLITVPSIESDTRGSRRTFRIFCCVPDRWAETISSPSRPTHTRRDLR